MGVCAHMPGQHLTRPIRVQFIAKSMFAGMSLKRPVSSLSADTTSPTKHLPKTWMRKTIPGVTAALLFRMPTTPCLTHLSLRMWLLSLKTGALWHTGTRKQTVWCRLSCYIKHSFPTARKARSQAFLRMRHTWPYMTYTHPMAFPLSAWPMRYPSRALRLKRQRI